MVYNYKHFDPTVSLFQKDAVLALVKERANCRAEEGFSESCGSPRSVYRVAVIRHSIPFSLTRLLRCATVGAGIHKIPNAENPVLPKFLPFTYGVFNLDYSSFASLMTRLMYSSNFYLNHVILFSGNTILV